MADQPVFAETEARFKGEAVAAVVGEPDAVANLEDFPVTWEPLSPLLEPDEALAEGADRVHASRPGNIRTADAQCARFWRFRDTTSSG